MTDARLLELFAMGVVLLDAGARVRAMNARARRLLAAGDGLVASGGRIMTSRREDGAALAHLLDGSCPHPHAGGLHARGAMQIVRRPPHPRLMLLVADAHEAPGAPASELVVFLHDPATPVGVSDASLRALHGLTRMEAKITALLVRGHAVAAIAADVGSSVNTVRTHLKRVFGKLDVASQSALMRVVLSGPAMLDLGGDRHGGSRQERGGNVA